MSIYRKQDLKLKFYKTDKKQRTNRRRLRAAEPLELYPRCQIFTNAKFRLTCFKKRVILRKTLKILDALCIENEASI